MTRKKIRTDLTDLDNDHRHNNNYKELYNSKSDYESYKEPKSQEITDSDLDVSNAYTLNHGLGRPPIDLKIIDNNDHYTGYSQVTVTDVDDNNVKIEFNEAISGTYKLKYS